MTTSRRSSRSTPTPADILTDYRYPDKRKNNPPAQLAGQGRIAESPKQRYSYDPHLPPTLRFDPNGRPDALPELLETARQRALNADEVQQLAEALRTHQPWLEWAGKREKKWFEVDPVALYIHERVSAQAIVRMAQRQDAQRTLWGGPELEYHEALQFYQHEMDWANRLILGDSLVVMNSLAKREDLAGKVQMIYMDPPYGIRFSSNFQPTVGNRNVTDREQDLTREPEMVKAYRDTWSLGVHSYLSYLRDRLYAAKDLLADTGSVFVQIGDENAHRVRAVMDEVFESENFVAEVRFVTTSGRAAEFLDVVSDHLLWYARDRYHVKYRNLWQPRPQHTLAEQYTMLELPTGEVRRATAEEIADPALLSAGTRRFMPGDLSSSGASEAGSKPFELDGHPFRLPPNTHWKTHEQGLRILASAGRLIPVGQRLRYRRYEDDFPVAPYTEIWSDTIISGYSDARSTSSRRQPKLSNAVS